MEITRKTKNLSNEDFVGQARERRVAQDAKSIVVVVAVPIVVALLLLSRVPTAAAVVIALLIAGILLVACIADGIATKGTEASADGRAFEAASTLVANDTACGSACKGTHDGARLGVGTRGTRNQGSSGEECQDELIHNVNEDRVVE